MEVQKTTTIDRSSPEQIAALADKLAGEIRLLMRTDLTQAQDKLDQLENSNPALLALVQRRLY